MPRPPRSEFTKVTIKATKSRLKSNLVPIVPEKSGNTKQISPAIHWCFTVNNYTPKDIEIYSSISSSLRYVFQEEIGESGTPHLQGYVEFKDKCRPLSKIPDNATPAHWEITRRIPASIAYCTKLETRKEGTKPYSNFWSEKRIDKRLINFQMRPWQKTLYDILMGEPDDRMIIWVVDQIGGQGKSLFAKWLCTSFPDILSVTMNKSADILTVVEEKYKTYMIDLPRSYDVQYTPFNAIEQIKNGYVTEGKLKKTARTLSFAPPHVVIFSNEYPDRSKLSKDRWNIIVL